MTDTTPVTAAQVEQIVIAAVQPIQENMATKKDVEYMIQAALQPIKDQMVTKDDLTRVATSLNKGIDQVLDVLVHTDQRLTGEVKHHEIRIKRLERKTGLAKVAA